MGDGSVPEPAPDAPLHPQAMALLRLGVTAAELADHARAFVPYGADYCTGSGALFSDAVRTLAYAEELVAAAIAAERAHGTTWEQLAEAVEQARSTVHKKWAPAAGQWEQRLTEFDDARLRGEDPPPVLGADPQRVAARLDAWLVRHREPGDLARGDTPVTDTLTRMEPLAELLHLSGQHHRLLELYLSPPPAALAAIAEREAVLYDHLADWDTARGNRRSAAQNTVAADERRVYAEALRRRAANGDTGKSWNDPDDAR